MASADVDDRLQAEMVLIVESHQFIVGLEHKAVMTAVHDQIVVLRKGDGSAVRLVERDGIMLAEVFLQERLGDFCSHKFSSLFLGAGAAYIQATLGFVDCSADTLQRRPAARTADIKGICGTMSVLGVEPEVVRDHLFKPHLALCLDCGTVGCGDHCHFLRTLGIAVNEWVILDIRHGSHRLSVCVKESTLAVCQCLCLCSEEYGGETILHLPEIHLLVTGHRHGHTTRVLEDDVAVIVTLGKILGTEIFDTRLNAVEEFVSYFSAPFVGFGCMGHRVLRNHRHRLLSAWGNVASNYGCFQDLFSYRENL